MSVDLRYLHRSLSKLSASALSASCCFHVEKSICGTLFLLCVTYIFIIRKEHKTDEMESFILNALSGEVLDKKSKKQMEAFL